MATNEPRRGIAFAGTRRIADGPLADVALRVKRAVDRGTHATVLVFDAETSERIDLDVRGSDAEVMARLAPPTVRTAGRPRLGVVAREVTLLPRHWDWLGEQPGGASVTLRKLVDEARRATVDAGRVRRAREATYRFMVAMAGDRRGFEEASRALFAGDTARFSRLIARWPADVRAQLLRLLTVSDGTTPQEPAP
ncbi:MAG: DUF2239 family protein [Gemmatimonadaceae bacterium]|nr:DUF2239 family protein [Gemmatimonadaceae bacterium]